MAPLHAHAAATVTWQGGGGNSLWSNPANWLGGAAPQSGDTAVFPAGAADLAPSDDINGLSLSALVIGAGGYTLGGSALTLSSLSTDTPFTAGTSTVAQTVTLPGGALAATIGGGAEVDLSSVAGSGHIEKNGAGRLVLGAVSYSDDAPDLVEQGVATVPTSTTAASQGNSFVVSAGAELDDVSRTGWVPQALTLAGTGAGGGGAFVCTSAAGECPLTGAITISTDTTLAVAGESLAKISGPISLSAGSLTLDADDPAQTGRPTWAVDISGAVSGPGGLIESGNRLAVLESSQATYTGTTTVRGGNLDIERPVMSSAVTVSSGVLRGPGPAGALLVGAGATVWPESQFDGDPASETVEGDATFEPGSAFMPCMSFGCARGDGARGTADELIVSGHATLAGILSLQGTWANGTMGATYTVLSAAGGVSGSFDNAPGGGDIRAASGAVYRVDYTATTVTVTRVPADEVSTQPQLTGSDGTTWMPLLPAGISTSPLPPTALGVIPTVPMEVSLNTSVWTDTAGYNQDVGIMMSDNGAAPSLIGWREAGGVGASYAPTTVQLQIPLMAVPGHAYVFSAVWKTNRNAPGVTIHAGAGPIDGAFSPTALALLGPDLFESPFLAPPAETVSTEQASFTGSDGLGWQLLPGMQQTFTATRTDKVGLDAEADLWTATAGYNQDLGIFIQDNGSPAQLLSWKEAAGAATYSPTPVTVHAILQAQGGHGYVITLRWKTNRNAPRVTIHAGAGPIDGTFSPTRLTVSETTPDVAVITTQPTLQSSDGATWQPIPGGPSSSLTANNLQNVATVDASADLFTDTPGYNQDLAIMVSVDGAAPVVLDWQESPGAFRFAPKATFVRVQCPVLSGHTYVFSLAWKTNRNAPGVTIHAGAGPINGSYSPTTLTVEAA